MPGSYAKSSLPPAVVMNLYYTGLGIARSLGERGIPVVGLTADPRIYGRYSRYVRPRVCADSRNEPEKLLSELLALGGELGVRSVLFPTRDHDVVLLDRYREHLEPHFALVIPPRKALIRCLDKWETYLAATEAQVPTPRCWLIEDGTSLENAAAEVNYPCVLKPLEAHHWRRGANWELVGGRKAISAESPDQLRKEYTLAARAEPRMLLQEYVPGADDCLVIAACYIDRQSRFRGGFNAQKLVQSPPLYGTGCIVQSADKPELFERTCRLLQTIGFTGVAEVEYKWDSARAEYQLIEVNPRPWDQHRLGAAGGVDLMYLAYCDHADLPFPEMKPSFRVHKWIAEDALVLDALRLLSHRQPGVRALLRQARGTRVYGIWSARDPLPALAHVARVVPSLVRLGLQAKRWFPGTAVTGSHTTASRAAK
jgi:predicted ATP-grasp superfamily ATP-dependent carboligase